MVSYKCKCCGAGASSKCIHRRLVFPDNQLESLLGNIAKRRVVRNQDGNTKVVITVLLGNRDADEKEKVLTHALAILREVDELTLKEWICDHKWEITDGECMFGCCVAQSDSPPE